MQLNNLANIKTN